MRILFWKFIKRVIYRDYGYCKERVDNEFGREGRCGACEASDVQDWIDRHIDLLKWGKGK